MDSTKLRCNTGLNVSPQARILGISASNACVTRALGTELCDTAAHPTASINGTKKMTCGQCVNWCTRAAGDPLAWFNPVETPPRRGMCFTELRDLIARLSDVVPAEGPVVIHRG